MSSVDYAIPIHRPEKNWSGSGLINEADTHATFVVPVLNCGEALVELVEQILCNCEIANAVELLLIDYGSTDDSWDNILALVDLYPFQVYGLKSENSKGLAGALQHGFDRSNGQFVVTMDPFSGRDASQIPQLLQKMADGYDLVCGSKNPCEHSWQETVPNQIAKLMPQQLKPGKLIPGKTDEVHLRGNVCETICYRREVAKSLDLYGEMYQQIPTLAGMFGYRILEMDQPRDTLQRTIPKYQIEKLIRKSTSTISRGLKGTSFDEEEKDGSNSRKLYCLLTLGLSAIGISLGLGFIKGLVGLIAAAGTLGMGCTYFFNSVHDEDRRRDNRRKTASAAASPNQNLISASTRLINDAPDLTR